VARIFLKRKREWNEGRPILPVDQSAASPTRGLFCREVLGMSLGEVRDYWTKIVLSGRDVPPPVQGGDANVMEFVRSQPGAIGYVSGEADLPSGVKAVEVVQ
jgi:ABC-type phosphate transport system substrate-binding protein